MSDKKNDRTHNSIRNIRTGIIYRIVNMMLPFIVRSVMIQTLGVEYLGFNSLFASILNVLNLTEFGFANAITYKMYKPAAENDYKQLSLLLSMYKKIYRIIGVAILVAGVIITPFVPKLISGEYPSEENIYVIFIIYLINTVLSYLLFAYKGALFNAYQRLDIQSSISTIITLLTNIIQITILVLIKNYYLYLLILPLFTIVNNGLVAYVTKKRYPQITSNMKFDNCEFRTVLGKAGAMFGHKLNYVIVSSADSIVISSFLGLVVLAKYGNYYTILSAVIGLSDTVTQAVLPSVGNLLVENDKDKIYKIFKIMSFAQYWFIGWCSICLVCLFQPFMKLWMGEKMLFGMGTVILFALYLFAYKSRAILLLFKDAAGMWKEDWIKPYVSGIFNVATNIVLVHYLGIWGVLLSTIISFAIINFLWEVKVVFQKLFKRELIKFFLLTIKYIFIDIVLCVITYALCNLIVSNQIIVLIIRAIICVFVPNILFAILNSRSTEFKELIHMVKRVREHR